ncbi:MAG: TonB-dependent receptor, partial [Myxococcota bacterium]
MGRPAGYLLPPLLLSLIASVPARAQAQESASRTGDDAESDEEPRPLEVVVRGRRPGMRGAYLEKLDRPTLDRLGVTSVAQALDRLPASTSSYGARGERIFSLRGFDQRQILVTLDGVPIQVPYDGQLDLGKFPLGLVQRVTVVKGAGSLLFGPNGLGGAVNIATRRPGTGPALQIATETAPFHAQRMSALASAEGEPIAFLGGVAYENVRYFPMAGSFEPTINEDGGRRDNSDRRSVSGIGKARWRIDDRNELIASAWRLDGRFGVPPGVYDLTRRFWRWTDWHVNTYALAHGYRDGALTLDETIYYSLVGNTLDIYDDGRYATQLRPQSGSSDYDDRTAGGNVRVSYRL